MARHWGRATAAGGVPFRFAPAEGTAFFASSRWRKAEFRSMWDESLRLRRTIPLAGFWAFVTRFYPAKSREAMRRMSGIVLLERAD